MEGANDNQRPAEIGTIRRYKGQTYVAVDLRPYERQDGTLTTLVVWRSRCARCDKPFELQTPLGAARFEPNRRCQKHKRPGHRVKP